jgi:hypothetical protein
MRVGDFVSCEEFGPRELLDQARLARRSGLDRVWISDHYHPCAARDARGGDRGHARALAGRPVQPPRQEEFFEELARDVLPRFG